MLIHQAHFQLPDWLIEQLPTLQGSYATVEERMELAIELSRMNVEHKTGGPFGAAIFGEEDGELVSVGVNLVESSGTSIAHAEVMAITLAQLAVGKFDLSAENRRHQLVTSSEPCAMCLGAIPWSGVHSVVCGARDVDVRGIGFEEGYKPVPWTEFLQQAQITSHADVLREKASTVLRQYAAGGGRIYNA